MGLQENDKRAAYKQVCSRGLNRGNKLYEGHRLVLHEHQETLLVSRRTEHLHGKQLSVVQETEEQEAIVRQAVYEQREVQICWEQEFNPLKLSADQYAEYLHSALNPRTHYDKEIKTERARIIDVLNAEGMLKCKLQTGKCLIAIKDVLSIKLL